VDHCSTELQYVFAMCHLHLSLRQCFVTVLLLCPPLRNCPLCQAPLTINKLYKQMYSLVNFFIKLSMLLSAQGLAAPLKSIDVHLGRRSPPVKNHCSKVSGQTGIADQCQGRHAHVGGIEKYRVWESIKSQHESIKCTMNKSTVKYDRRNWQKRQQIFDRSKLNKKDWEHSVGSLWMRAVQAIVQATRGKHQDRGRKTTGILSLLLTGELVFEFAEFSHQIVLRKCLMLHKSETAQKCICLTKRQRLDCTSCLKLEIRYDRHHFSAAVNQSVIRYAERNFVQKQLINHQPKDQKGKSLVQAFNGSLNFCSASFILLTKTWNTTCCKLEKFQFHFKVLNFPNTHPVGTDTLRRHTASESWHGEASHENLKKNHKSTMYVNTQSTHCTWT